MQMRVKFNLKWLGHVDNLFGSLKIFSKKAEQFFIKFSNNLIINPASNKQETAVSLLCYLRYKRIIEMNVLQCESYLDLRNLASIKMKETKFSQKTTAEMQISLEEFALHKLTVPEALLNDCKKLTKQNESKKDELVFQEEDIYSLSANISPPTPMRLDIEPFLKAFSIAPSKFSLEDLNDNLVQKLRNAKVGQYSVCEKEFGNLNPKLKMIEMAPHIVDCVIEVINEKINFGEKVVLNKEDKESWIKSLAGEDRQLKAFKILREFAEGQESTFNILCVLYASLMSYKSDPISLDGSEKYILDDSTLNNILETLSFSASIAHELENYEGEEKLIQDLVDEILQYIDQRKQPIILPFCTPIPPNGEYSEHAFYAVLKRIDDDQYKVSIVNCGFCSQYNGVVDFPTLNRKDILNYIKDAFSLEFHKTHDDGKRDENKIVKEHVKDVIYTNKFGDLKVSNNSVNEQFYGNCATHNYNYAIKHCFDLNTVNFGIYRQITLVGFDKFVSGNKERLTPDEQKNIIIERKKAKKEKAISRSNEEKGVSLSCSSNSTSFQSSQLPSSFFGSNKLDVVEQQNQNNLQKAIQNSLEKMAGERTNSLI